jgi:NADPH:quinone reductase-like Zn-dependent oxidoreductase
MRHLLVLVLCMVISSAVSLDMRALQADGYVNTPANFSSLSVRRVPRPASPLPSTSVLVRVVGSSVNPVDWKLAEFSILPLHFPATLGMDMAGVVTAVGSAVGSLKPGARVWADLDCPSGELGGFGEFVSVDESCLGIVPAELPLHEAAVLPLVTMTGLAAFQSEGHTGAPWPASANKTVVVLGASGGCGASGVEMALAFGAKTVYGTTLGAVNLPFVRSLGAGVVAIDAAVTKDWVTSVGGANSVDVIYDTVGVTGTADEAMRALRKGGAFVTIAGALSKAPKVGVTQTAVHHWVKNRTALDKVAALVQSGHLKAHIQRSFPLEETVAAFTLSAKGGVVGKLAINISAEIASSTAVPHGGGPCTGVVDCQLNGRCIGGKCACRPSWTSGNCSVINLLPATRGVGFGSQTSNFSSWGNKIRKDPKSGKFYLAADEIANHCGLGTWGGNSRSVMAEALNVSGPYVRKQVVVDSWSHGTWMERDPVSGRWILGHMGAGASAKKTCKVCTGGITRATDKSAPCPLVSTVPAAVQAGALIADSPLGPWKSAGKNLINGANCEPFFAHNGTLYFACPYGGPAKNGTNTCKETASLTLSRAESLSDALEGKYTYKHVAPILLLGGTNQSNPCVNWEGNNVYVDEDGYYHSLAHAYRGQPTDYPMPGCNGRRNASDGVSPCTATGGHMYSLDGKTWFVSPVAPFTSTIEFTDGVKTTFRARERSHLVFGKAGELLFLGNGMGNAGKGENTGVVGADHTFVQLQPIATKAPYKSDDAIATTPSNGDVTVGPMYTADARLTDLGAVRGVQFNFSLVIGGSSSSFNGSDATLEQNNVSSECAPCCYLPTSPSASCPCNNTGVAECCRKVDTCAVRKHRQVNVYIPARYVAGNAAPLLVMQDGPGYKLGNWSFTNFNFVARALDNIKALPAFAAIAVENGGSDAIGSERGLEYDTMSGRYAAFLASEVLPAVLAHPAAVKARLKFSFDPAERALMGCSSGGAASLAAAWHRSDLFRKVIAYSGTFVDQQQHNDRAARTRHPFGAWDWHSAQQLIRNSPKLPLKIFTHCSEHDLGYATTVGAIDESSSAAIPLNTAGGIGNCHDQTCPGSVVPCPGSLCPGAWLDGHHNWAVAGNRTRDALKAKAYEYRHVFALGAHHCDPRVVAQTLGDTLVWLWAAAHVPLKTDEAAASGHSAAATGEAQQAAPRLFQEEQGR